MGNRIEDVMVVHNAVERVCQELGDVTTAQVMSRERTFKVAAARQMGMWFLWTRCKMSFTDIGRAMGKHHATIMYGVRHAEVMIQSEKSYGRKYRDLAEKLNGDAACP